MLLLGIDAKGEDLWVVSGIDGKQVLIVMNTERPAIGIVAKAQFTLLQHRTVMVDQEGQQYLVTQGRVYGVPVDVEIRRVARGFAVFQYVEPPRVVTAAHAHVVRNDVQELSHLMPVQDLDIGGKTGGVADLRVQDIVIHDVVTMRTA